MNSCEALRTVLGTCKHNINVTAVIPGLVTLHRNGISDSFMHSAIMISLLNTYCEVLFWVLYINT